MGLFVIELAPIYDLYTYIREINRHYMKATKKAPGSVQDAAQKMLADKAYLMKMVREGKQIDRTELKKQGIELASISFSSL